MRSGFISVVGRPNVGKSTLVNRLVGEKIAIVTPKPQTTRNRILAIANTARAQMVLIDTPGIHKPDRELNRLMVESALDSLNNVDVVLLLIDLTERFGTGDARVLEHLEAVKAAVVLGINKIDLAPRPAILPVIDDYSKRRDFSAIVPFSALTGENVDRLIEVLEETLPEGEPLYPEDTLTDLPERFFVSEMVREKILELTRHEVPYSTAVVVDSWEDRENLTRIEATILVERPTQKGILIGRAGAMLKKIGAAARQDIEGFLGTRVFLGLHVKVRPDWRDNKRILAELGIEPRS